MLRHLKAVLLVMNEEAARHPLAAYPRTPRPSRMAIDAERELGLLTSARVNIDIQTFTEGMTCLSSEVLQVETKYHPECVQIPWLKWEGGSLPHGSKMSFLP
jgi:hypothetical protein